MHQDFKIEDFIHLTEADTKGLEGDKWMMVQKVQVVPLPFLEIGHGDRRERKVEEGWDSFRKSIHNKTSFSNRLLEEERNLAELLEKELWLKQHFQILIDITGRIIHFDLDRGYYYRRLPLQKDVSKYLMWVRDIAMGVSHSNFTGYKYVVKDGWVPSPGLREPTPTNAACVKLPTNCQIIQNSIAKQAYMQSGKYDCYDITSNVSKIGIQAFSQSEFNYVIIRNSASTLYLEDRSFEQLNKDTQPLCVFQGAAAAIISSTTSSSSSNSSATARAAAIAVDSE